MFDLLVDIWQMSETEINGEPQFSGLLFYEAVPARFEYLSGNTRYLAAGQGVAVNARLVIDWRTSVNEECQVRNIRTRESLALSGHPTAYRITHVNPGRRRHHLELDLEALR